MKLEKKELLIELFSLTKQYFLNFKKYTFMNYQQIKMLCLLILYSYIFQFSLSKAFFINDFRAELLIFFLTNPHTLEST